MSDKSAVLGIHQSLRKCFQVIDQQQDSWNNTLPECKPLLNSLGNVAEQLQACNKVKFENTPLAQYPDIQPRLRYKLVAAIDLILEKLEEKMNELQKVRDLVSHQVEAVFQVYEQQTGAVGMQVCLEGSVVYPSIADMLEWLQDIDNHYRQEYLKRRLLLQVKDDQLPVIRELPDSWQKIMEDSNQDLVPDILLKVSFFREAM